jgi:hypothetical protein
MNALSTQKISMLAEHPSSFSMAARDVYPLICVRDPYFAYQRFDVESGTVTSSIATEQPLRGEVGPMCAAEAGRHLAILGSCAAAMANPTRARHYYLAREAYAERTRVHVPEDSTNLTARARATLPDKRTAHANCGLYAGEEKLFSLECTYSVLSEALFTRFYGKYATEPDNVTPFQRVNPYRSSMPLEIFEQDHLRMRGSLGTVKKEFCAGHFTRYPCLPVAVLMHSLCGAAGTLFSHRAGTPIPYSIEYCEVAARELAFAGTRIDVEASYTGDHPRGDKFVVRAITDTGTVIGELTTVLKGMGAARQAEAA